MTTGRQWIVTEVAIPITDVNGRIIRIIHTERREEVIPMLYAVRPDNSGVSKLQLRQWFERHHGITRKSGKRGRKASPSSPAMREFRRRIMGR